MTDTQSRRRALLSLLDQFPLERDLYLYEGRRAVSPREEFADKIEALFAPSLFEQVMTASERYVTRFGGELSLEGAMTKMHEEWDEMHQEIKLAAMDAELVSEGGGVDSDIAKELLAKEAIDLLVTIGGVLAALRTPITMTVDAAHVTLDKLDNRTEADYCWDEKSKTVIKRSKLEVQS